MIHDMTRMVYWDVKKLHQISFIFDLGGMLTI